MQLRIRSAHAVVPSFILAALLAVFGGGFSFAQIFTDTSGLFSIDFPEGFAMDGTDAKTGYYFQHTVLPIEAVARVYSAERFSTPQKALSYVFRQLHASGETDSFVWRNQPCAIAASITMIPDGTPLQGMAVCVNLPLQKGVLTLIVYTPQQYFSSYAQLLASVADSICIDRGSYFEAGPVTAYAFPPEGSKDIALSVDGTAVQTSVDAADEPASRFLIDREYAVLELFAESVWWRAAWQRYYRLIYRDSYRRLEKVSFDIYAALAESAALETDGAAEPGRTTETGIPQKLLRWIQSFPYGRDPAGSDFTPLTLALCGMTSDCDSRSMLLAVLLSHMNYRTALFVSREYGHALAGVDMEGKGARLQSGSTAYLLCETTAGVDIGFVAKDMSDSTKWIPVELAE